MQPAVIVFFTPLAFDLGLSLQLHVPLAIGASPAGRLQKPGTGTKSGPVFRARQANRKTTMQNSVVPLGRLKGMNRKECSNNFALGIRKLMP
jgi:hypothetical protein